MSEDADQGDLESRMAALPDGELLRIVGSDREEYRAEALKCARAEVARRGLSMPEPSVRAAADKPLARISALTKGLLVTACVYTLVARLVPDLSDAGRGLSPSLGLGLVGAMLWSMAWDMRTGASGGGFSTERTWHKGVVFWAGIVTLAAVYFGARELKP